MGAEGATVTETDVVTVAQAAERLGIPLRRVRQWQNQHRFVAVGTAAKVKQGRPELVYRLGDVARAASTVASGDVAERLGLKPGLDRRVGTEEAVALLGVTRSRIERWLAEGLLPSSTKSASPQPHRREYSLRELLRAKAGMADTAGNPANLVVPDGFLTLADAARQMGVTVASLKNLYQKGFSDQFQRLRIGRLGHRFVWYVRAGFAESRRRVADAAASVAEYRPGEYPLPDFFALSPEHRPMPVVPAGVPADVPAVIARDERAVAELLRRRAMFAGRRVCRRVFGEGRERVR